MQDPTTLPKDQLLELLKQQEIVVDQQDLQLKTKSDQLATQDELLANQSGQLTTQGELLTTQGELLTTQGEQLTTQGEQLTTQVNRIAIQEDTIKQLEQKCEDLELSYAKLLREKFNASSERFINDPGQLSLDLDFGDTDAAVDAAAGLAEAVEEADLIPAHRRRKPRKKRDESLPEHLPRYEVTADVAEDLKNCETHGERTLLPEAMWDKTETLEFEPPVLKVRVTKYPKYACPSDPQCGISTPERITGIIEGNKYDTSIAAEIITGKFSYHLPVYRLQDYFAGSGWTPSRSTLLNILASCSLILAPLLAYFKRIVQEDSVIGCDDTGVTLLYPKTPPPPPNLDDPKSIRIHEVFTRALEKDKPSISAKMWAYRGTNVKLNVFDFTVSRHRDGPELFFADYSGTLLGDCWHGFESIALASDGEILRAGCNSHARRKIRDSVAYPADRKHWLLWFQELYDIEDRGKVMSPNQRLELRQSESKPIWEAMEVWLQEVKVRTSNVILPKSDFAKALQYIRNHFVELQRYLHDASIPIDNNETEQLMKQVAIGRKNWMFSGSVAGGERTAGFLTLTSSALRNDLDVWRYVKDVLDQLLAGVTDYEPLLPWNWATKHPGAIRQYRVRERKDRAERKQTKREQRRRRAKLKR